MNETNDRRENPPRLDAAEEAILDRIWDEIGLADPPPYRIRPGGPAPDHAPYVPPRRMPPPRRY